MQIGTRSRLERQVGNIDDRTAAEHHEPLDRVLELADVAGPTIGRQRRDRCGRELDAAAGAAARAFEERLHQQGDVFTSIPQGGHVYDDNAEAVEEILPETLLRDLALEVHVRRRHDADVDLYDSARPDRTNLSLLQHAEELDLQRR